jgi:hypothetical protein
MTVRSGPHLGAVREWIKCRAYNGEYVTWGSEEHLKLDVTVRDMERLAQRIYDSVARDLLGRISICSDFQSEITTPPYKGTDRVNVCAHCGFTDRLHEEADILWPQRKE